MINKKITPPLVMWAQKSGQVFLTFCLEDCKNPTVKIDPEKIYFKGVGGTEKKEHEVTINFYGEIDPETSVQNSKGRLYEVTLTKKEFGPFWPRLTKEEQKFHWLKIDFNKYNDEEDSSSDGERSQDFEKNLKDFAYFNNQEESKPDFGDFDEDNDRDSDDDNLPDLE
ncbi:prostaglandin E synthase 3 isoform X2 [Chelonus insularis]|uniref:prostaglandin E synthase 3 isoform X2 n=1 Tax=Chelonus insularis TaxID=460826 RepID=UPI00158E172C|nr:prostaglandin E synthase 3 isoform X2 [Chelonus insularis]